MKNRISEHMTGYATEDRIKEEFAGAEEALNKLLDSTKKEDGTTDWQALGALTGLMAIELKSDRLADLSLMVLVTGAIEDGRIHRSNELDAEVLADLFDEINADVTASDVSQESGNEDRWHRFCFDSNAGYYLGTEGYVPENPYLLGKELVAMLKRRGRA